MIALISTFYFFYFGIIGVYIIFMPKVLEMVGYSASEIGIIFSAAPLVRFLVPFLFIKGFRLGKTSFYYALVILFISAFAFYFSLHHFYALLLSNILFGVGLSLILPYVELISLQEIGKERYGKSRLFGSIGFMVVALVLVKFLTNPTVALNYLLLLTLLTTLFATIVAKKAHSLKKEQQHQQRSIPILQDFKLWAGFAFVQISFGAFYNFFTIYETAHGVSLDMTIYLWSFGVFIEIAMLYFQGKLLHGNLLRIILICVGATIIRWLLVFAYADVLWVMFASQALHALSFALFHSAAISYLYHRYESKALSQQLFSGISYGLGSLLGAFISGYIYEYAPKYLFLSSALFATIAFWLLFSFAKSDTKRSYLA